jgi:hypothetical protein
MNYIFFFKRKKMQMSYYLPPCWVNSSLQKTLSSSVKISNVDKVGRELWEASGGSEDGFLEFKKYLKRFNCFSDIQAIKIWNQYSSRGQRNEISSSKQQNLQKKLSPLSPSFDKICPDCENVLPGGKNLCNSCSDTSDIVKNVVKFVFA